MFFRYEVEDIGDEKYERLVFEVVCKFKLNQIFQDVREIFKF